MRVTSAWVYISMPLCFRAVPQAFGYVAVEVGENFAAVFHHTDFYPQSAEYRRKFHPD